jgi:hypothetical protein
MKGGLERGGERGVRKGAGMNGKNWWWGSVEREEDGDGWRGPLGVEKVIGEKAGGERFGGLRMKQTEDSGFGRWESAAAMPGES